MRKIQLCLCCLLTILISNGCSSKKDTVTLEKYSMTSTSLGFDTVVMFTAYAKDEHTYKQYEQILQDEFKRYDKLFDKYHNYDGINNIKTINDHAGDKPIKVDEPIMELLKQSKEYDALSNHQFSVTMGAVLDLWHDAREAAEKNPKNATIPSKKALQQANTYTGWEHVELDEKTSTVYINNSHTQLDVGAIAKGYAVEKVAQKLEKAGLKHAIINGGGNVRLIGAKPDGSAWNVGLQIPNYDTLSSDSLASISINESSSFVTSGDYQRYYTYKGQIMHHIIDPSTLMPAKHCRSVTVITKDGGIADMLSTTLYTVSHAEGEKILAKIRKEKGISVEAIWVYDDTIAPEDDTATLSSHGYQLVMSEGAEKMLKK